MTYSDLITFVILGVLSHVVVVIALITGAVEVKAHNNNPEAKVCLIGIHVFSILVIFAALAHGQVLTTAETLGAGKQTVCVSENHLDDAGTGINIAYVMYAKGLTSRFDLYTAVGETQLLGEGQVWAGIGGNAKLFSVRKTSVSLFTLASVPLHRFNKASVLLLNTALVVSRPISSKLSVYSGVNTLVPIGKRDQGFFTPADNKLNFPLGASVALGNWGLTAEADLGKLKAVGIALSRTF